MGGIVGHPIAAIASWAILILGLGGVVTVSAQYRYVAVLAVILLIVMFTARAARLMWQEQRDAAERAFRPGSLTGTAPHVEHADTVNVHNIYLAPGQAVPRELLPGNPPVGGPGPEQPQAAAQTEGEGEGPSPALKRLLRLESRHGRDDAPV